MKRMNTLNDLLVETTRIQKADHMSLDEVLAAVRAIPTSAFRPVEPDEDEWTGDDVVRIQIPFGLDSRKAVQALRDAFGEEGPKSQEEANAIFATIK